jgi:hypothetical protein
MQCWGWKAGGTEMPLLAGSSGLLKKGKVTNDLLCLVTRRDMVLLIEIRSSKRRVGWWRWVTIFRIYSPLLLEGSSEVDHLREIL